MHKILIFGDSITIGKGVAMNQSYVSKLTYFFNKKNLDILIYNLGISGESSTELLKRFEAECRNKTQRRTMLDKISIVIAIGINDSRGINFLKNYNTKKNVYSQNINSLIDIGKKYTNNIFFIGLTPVDEQKTKLIKKIYFINANIKIYNNIIKKICEKRKIIFVEIFNDWIKKAYKRYLTSDGLHPNKIGHQMIFDKINHFFTNTSLTSFELYQILKKEYSLSEEDIKTIKSKFIKNRALNNEFLIGQTDDSKSNMVIGAPCIRKDIENISLNTAYQIFMPLKVASELKIPCMIFLGIKEEIIFQSKQSAAYKKLGLRLKNAIKKISKDLKVSSKIIDTSIRKYDFLINKYIDKLDIKLSIWDSTNLFNLSREKTRKPPHSTLRIYSNKRVLACNTTAFLKELFKPYSFLIVEDLEQLTCVQFAQKFDNNEPPNFLAFLPLPNIKLSTNMFKSIEEERFLLGQNISYYRKIFKKSKPLALKIYKIFLLLVGGTGTNLNQDFMYYYKIICKISNYFL